MGATNSKSMREFKSVAINEDPKIMGDRLRFEQADNRNPLAIKYYISLQ